MDSSRDEKQLLGSKVLSLDELDHHARRLAARQELGLGLGPDRLLPRLADNEAVLVGAYERLSAAVRAKERISPAGEWLLDNFYVIGEQVRLARRHLPQGYSRELPFLTNGPAPGQPRAYAIALEVIAHVDARVDSENISRFVAAYQQVAPLKLGEYWAIPIMLRLALIENLRRVAARVVVALEERSLANHWADKLLAVAETDPKRMLLVAADMARAEPPMSNAFVAELLRRLHGQSLALDIPLAWIEAQLAESELTTAQTVHQEGQQQAANQVSVGASIGSLRFLSAMDWREFVEASSAVEAVLRRDPAKTYCQMDFATRDHYRHVVERLAKRNNRDELEIAQCAVQLAAAHAVATAPTARQSHVGYYLVDKGLAELQAFARDYATLPAKSGLLGHGAKLFLYLAAVLGGTAAITLLVVERLGRLDVSGLSLAVAGICLALAASQLAVTLVNWLATVMVKPHLLPRLDFSKGIPVEYSSLVAIPSMLGNPRHIERLLEALEVRYLANRDEHLRFALVTDFGDAACEHLPQDEALVALARRGIEDLNAKYGGKTGELFYLLHRSRLWCAQERVWMGYERKRGKLAALNALLRCDSNPATSSGFSVVVGDLAGLRNIKYVITLDTDTQLPRDAARQLVGTMAHPLNWPVFDTDRQRVVAGYGILQPRIAVSLPGSRRSLYARLYAGDAGIDPYTRAVSDMYQDLFHEGSFIGKGIYDVDAVTVALDRTLPENLILSHDLLEGNYCRSGLVSDVELFEEYPSHYLDDAMRRHRWMRGDWQILAWLLPRVPGHGGKWRQNPLSMLAKWKILDNLRRSLVPLATATLLTWGWAVLDQPGFLTGVVVAMSFLPPLVTSLAAAVRKPREGVWKSHLLAAGKSTLQALAQAALAVVFLPFDALMSLDAILRSLIRMLITRTHLLSWKSASDSRDDGASRLVSFYRSMAIAPVMSLALGGAFLVWRPGALLSAMPLLALWLVAPAVAYRLSRLLRPRQQQLTASQVAFLRRLARKTWRFFETFVGPDDHWLPPDNFQEYPAAVIAHRTSPTNIGLSLLANLSAYDFGYLSAASLMERTVRTFQTLELLERLRGHFYNWYDTLTLKPLLPLYVSTVDSGNLAGLLLTLKPGLRELEDHPIIPAQLAQGLLDTVNLLIEAMEAAGVPVSSISRLEALRLRLGAPAPTLAAAKDLYSTISKALLAASTPTESQEVHWWTAALTTQAREGLHEALVSLAPWTFLTPLPTALMHRGSLFRLLADLESIPTRREVANLGQTLLPLLDTMLQEQSAHAADQAWLESLRQAVSAASRFAEGQIQALERLAVQSEELATFEYDFLYDKSRDLLAIGYNASEHRRDASFYDLLASEARLCSFVGIAQGYLPQEHWFALGRLTTTSRGEPTLLSWSGSMFEYLMPLLVMPTFENTLLDKTCQTAVKRQIEYGYLRGVPWGISESGYNFTDVHFNYQYRAFGVPGLGFKRGLADDLVVAPYASVMAIMIAPEAACANLQRLSALGFEGRYGFYEAVDYTPARLATDQPHAILRSFMAHHEGMSFLSLAHRLLGQKMQQRFLSDPLFQATELLLHERIPRATTAYLHAPEVSPAARLADERAALLRVITSADTPRPEVHLLSNGRYTVMVTNAGGGYSRWRDLALTRWREDPSSDDWGSFCYVRDVTSGDTWSAAFQPSLAKPDHYEAIFPQARAEFRRRDHDLEMHTEITVSPEDDIELRRFSITNLSSTKRVIELTSYAEVVLAAQAADEAHAAFSNLFVQTEIIDEKQAILCTRRPRSETEGTPTMLHLMTVHGPMVGKVSYETDRRSFIGRGRTVASPAAMERATLEGHDGSVLDPIVAIRCRIEIEPEQTVKVHVVTGVGETRDVALGLMGKYHDRHVADRVFELAWTHRQIVLRQLDISEVDAQLYGRLASSVLYANPARRPSRRILAKNNRGQSGLWSYGISGDLPIVLLRVSEPDRLQLVRQLLQAHGYWRSMGLQVDLVIWNEDKSGYRQLLQEQIMALVAETAGVGLVDKPGGIFVRRGEQMSGEDQILLQTVARAVLSAEGGSLQDQIERRGLVPAPMHAFVASLPRGDLRRSPGKLPLAVSADASGNGLGQFSPDGREYIITTTAASVTPMPWVNVIANPFFGTVVSESGSAYTWCENAHEFRLTPWSNDPITDRSGEAFYLRDEETGQFWSPSPLPTRGEAPYVTRHGFGYSVFSHKSAGIDSEMTSFVAIDAPVKIALIKLRNSSGRARRISLTGYCEWVLGELRARSLMHIVTEIDVASSALLARNPYHSEFGERIAFFDVNTAVRSVTGDRSEFLGRNGRLGDPNAMRQSHLSGKLGAARDACGAIQTVIELADGDEHEVAFILGVGRDVADVRTLIARFRGVPAAHQALIEVKGHWDRTLGSVQIQTPDRSLDVLTNGWLIYQVIACRIWARSGYYQSGGAYGFRDQLQDSMALVHAKPTLLREHILRCASRQFRDGDVQHWWHPPSGRGVRTNFSDDFLWLPLATSRYVLAVGDTGVLDERVAFIEGRHVKHGEEAYCDVPTRSDETATLYEHCVRAINHGLRYGRHGLPLMGCGDWNDGMNLVGQDGRGESVWLGFFLFDLLGKFAEVARIHGDLAFVEVCALHRVKLQTSLETGGWDGAWYRRAYFDDGSPLGSALNSECQIDALPQSWAVLSGCGDPERARLGMEAVSQRLIDWEAGIVKLFDPPFDKGDLNPGYIKGYVPGVRENGGQYTHAAIWTAMAFAERGDQARAWQLLAMINPLHHAETPQQMATYMVEPYVMAADVYAVAPHNGRGGWTWYTGAAGWMYRLILESLLGLRLDVDKLSFKPCVPAEWQGFQLRYRFRETIYDIKVSIESGRGAGTEVTLDGCLQPGDSLRLIDDGVAHKVEVALGTEALQYKK